MTPSILLTGASGYVGSRLLPSLQADGLAVRCLARSPESLGAPPAGRRPAHRGRRRRRGRESWPRRRAGGDRRGLLPHPLDGTGQRARQRVRRRAIASPRATSRRRRGGPASAASSTSAASARPATARPSTSRAATRSPTSCATRVPTWRTSAPPWSSARAARPSRCCVRSSTRLPAMICPKWVDTRSQPIAIDDVVSTLNALATRPDVPADVQIGGADVLTYREMMGRFARVVGRRPAAHRARPRPDTPPLVLLGDPRHPGGARPRPAPRQGPGHRDGRRAPRRRRGSTTIPLGFEAAVRAALAEA